MNAGAASPPSSIGTLCPCGGTGAIIAASTNRAPPRETVRADGLLHLRRNRVHIAIEMPRSQKRRGLLGRDQRLIRGDGAENHVAGLGQRGIRFDQLRLRFASPSAHALAGIDIVGERCGQPGSAQALCNVISGFAEPYESNCRIDRQLYSTPTIFQ